MAADARVKTYAVNDLLRVQALALRVGIQLIEIGNAQRQIGVGEQLDGFGLGKAHEERINVLLDGTFLQQCRKFVGGCDKVRILRIGADDDAGRVEVVIQGLGLSQKFRAEQDVPAAEPFPHRHRVATGIVDLMTMRAFGLTSVTRRMTASTAEVSKCWVWLS